MSFLNSNSQAAVSPDDVNMKDKAYKICRDFLSGTWKSISSSDMVFKSIKYLARILLKIIWRPCPEGHDDQTKQALCSLAALSGGFTNVLYYCSLPETHTSLVGEPNQVLLRMYGQIHEGRADATITESVIFMMLSERKLGPKLYGIFPGGRLEEYIPARALTCQELHDPEISAVIARKLARVHTLQVPINKEPSWLFDKMELWLEFIRKNVSLDKMSNEKQKIAENVLTVDLKEEISWLKSYLRKVDSPVVFSHNDLQEGNILLPDGPQKTEDKLVFIDFEYCSYNFRGFDLGNHFCEWGYDYSSPAHPHYVILEQEYPTLQEQLHFIRAYLSAMDPPASQEESLRRQRTDTEAHLLEEANAFVLASHMLWCLWAVFQAHTSKIAFGYLEYSATRLEAYFRWKKHLLGQASIKRKQETE